MLCKLITGRSHVGNDTIQQPREGFDRTTNGDGSYIVIYDPSCILPLAIIEYSIDLKRG
mgnify:CR=1 FL=1